MELPPFRLAVRSLDSFTLLGFDITYYCFNPLERACSSFVICSSVLFLVVC